MIVVSWLTTNMTSNIAVTSIIEMVKVHVLSQTQNDTTLN